MQYLCFIEFEDELQVLLANLDQQADTMVVPLTERARHAATRAGLQTMTLDELVTNRTHLRVIASCTRMMAEVDAHLPPGPATLTGIKTFRTHVSNLLHSVSYLCDVVLTATARVPEATLVAVRSPFAPSGTGEIRFALQRILWKVVAAVAKARGRVVSLFDAGFPTERPETRKPGPIARFCLKLANHILLMQWRRQRLVLVPSITYGMGDLAAVLRRHGIQTVIAREGGRDGLRSVAGAVWGIISGACGLPFGCGSLRSVLGVLSLPLPDTSRNGEWMRLSEQVLADGLVYRGIDLGWVIRDKVIGDVVNVAVRSEELAREYQHVFQSLRPLAIVSQGARFENGLAIGEAGTRGGIQTVLISHGSHVSPKNRVEELALGDHADGLLFSPAYQVVAIQSPLAEEALRKISPGTQYLRSRPVMWGYRSVGPNPNAGREPTILHASTPKARSGWRPWWYETSEEYIEGLIKLIEAVEHLRHGRLVIRCRSFPELSVEDLRARLPVSPQVSVKTGGNFSDDLASADLLVSFSSTTMEEALQARRPVLQYGANGRYQHLPGLVWGEEPPRRSAVYSVLKAADLESALRWILNQHARNVLTDEDLRGYVFPETQALSADDLARCLADPELLKSNLVRVRD